MPNKLIRDARLEELVRELNETGTAGPGTGVQPQTGGLTQVVIMPIEFCHGLTATVVTSRTSRSLWC